MDWVFALGVFILLMCLMPAAMRAVKRSTRGRGRMAGAALAIGLAFSTIFDPAQAAAIETMKKKKEAGEVEEDAAGELLD
jgi:hypothetical protein